jgi:AraC-like DNA-binding protein
VKVPNPKNEFSLWRPEHLFDIGFAAYSLSHHHFPRHFHDHYVIEVVTEGGDQFYCNGKNYVAGDGQMVLINPGEVHTGSTIGDTRLRYLSFCPNKEQLKQVAEILHISLPNDLLFRETLSSQPVLSRKMGLLFESLNNKSEPVEQELHFYACMQELLQVNQAQPTPRAQKDNRINLLVDFIRSHFKDNITLAQMAAMVNLNPFHLTRLFKRITSMTPYDYLLVVRTEFARQLLSKGYRVHEAAEAAGFYDSSHLNRSLRKIAGTSPKSFLSSKGQYRTIFNG